MTEHDIVKEWLEIAHNDYTSAKFLFDNMHPKPLEIICYHCQQSAEKSLKAYLCANGKKIAKTHETGVLCNQCLEINDEFSQFSRVCEELVIYATETRYPIRIETDELTAERLLQQVLEIYVFVAELVDVTDKEKT